MLTVRAMNVNDAYILGMTLLASNHVLRDTRNGPALVCPEPVATRYAHPRQRVLFEPSRDANPFFHLFEALWMLDGGQDVAVPAYFVPRMAEFSDDGQTFNAAYGHRWRWAFGYDQLSAIVVALSQDPLSRRAILQMWDPTTDLTNPQSKDLPCNTAAKFHIWDGKLHLTVFNRSNDIIWGCYGANAVQFSVLQEYMATRLNVGVGYYEQISSDFHAYRPMWEKHWPGVEQSQPIRQGRPINPYLEYREQRALVAPRAIVVDPHTFEAELTSVVRAVRHEKLHRMELMHYANSFFQDVAQPMYQAYRCYRGSDPIAGIALLEEAIDTIGKVDWLVAGSEWLRRRLARRAVVRDHVTTKQGEVV